MELFIILSVRFSLLEVERLGCVPSVRLFLRCMKREHGLRGLIKTLHLNLFTVMLIASKFDQFSDIVSLRILTFFPIIADYFRHLPLFRGFLSCPGCDYEYVRLSKHIVSSFLHYLF